MSPQVWFITGTSTGFGRALTELLLKSGEIVVATLRTPSVLDALTAEYPSSKLLVLKVDVTVPADIAAAFAAAKAAFGRIDVVYNNSAIGVLGEIEGFPEATARKIFDVNYWGALNVSSGAVQFFREVNAPGVGGRLIVASSLAASAAAPALGQYSATKWALEGATEALSKEVDPAWNIKITLVEFGGFNTPGSVTMPFTPAHPAYSNPALPVAWMRGNFSGRTVDGDPAKAVRVLVKLAQLPDPPLRLPVGQDVLGAVAAQAKSLAETVEKYRSLSDDLSFDA